MGHEPNRPSSRFKGKSRIGNYGDKMMEGNYYVGQILDALKELGVDDNTLLVFAADYGPFGEPDRWEQQRRQDARRPADRGRRSDRRAAREEARRPEITLRSKFDDIGATPDLHSDASVRFRRHVVIAARPSTVLSLRSSSPRR